MKDLIDYFTEREWYLMRFVHDTFRQPYSESSLENWLSDGIADGGIIVADQVLKSAPEDARIAALEAQLAASEAKCADTYQDVLLAIRDAEYYRMQLSDERLKFSAALARAEEAEREKDELLLAVSALMKAFDDGVFVRDTSNDNRPDWAIRLFNPLRALAVLREASDAALRQEMGVRGDE